MPTFQRCRREIQTLHEFFVQWYTGSIDRDVFDRLEYTLAPEFEMISPTGDRNDRTTVLATIRDSYGEKASGTFDIEIRNVEIIRQFDECSLVRYEEWQYEDGDENARISTVLLRADDEAPSGVVWLDLQETAFDG
ncbi:MAG: hypothetical protein ACI9PP_000306 [Halobacteriales archaeon]|jgi:hypothetical protein